MQQIVQGPFLPLIAWTVGVALLTQVYKRVTKAASIRHHALVERTLPLVPIVIGIASGAAAPHELGLKALLANGHHELHWLGAFFGAGVGAVSSGVFQAVLQWVPESIRESFTMPIAEEEGGGG